MSYVIINYPKFKALTANGDLAVGYKVYTYAPGTTTPQTTYNARSMAPGTENTNPIILDSAGECIIYTGETVKLVLKTTADATVWTFDYLAEQQSTRIVNSVPVTSSHNQYVVTSSPALGAYAENTELIMTPNVSNTSTLTSNVFTGTGIDDCTESGAFTGTTSGSIYYVEIDGAYEAPPTAPTAVETSDVGLVTAGNHYVKVSFVTAIGETTLSPASAVVASDGSETIDVSNIATGSAQVTARKVYMTEAGGTDYYLVDTIPDNVTTTYTISIADATLAGNDPAPTSDTTGTADTFKWKKDAGAYTTGVAITMATQTLAEGIKVSFAVDSGHTLGDLWAITVETPARVNLDSLGSLIVYKNKNGVLVPLDAGDMQAGYPAQMIMNKTLDAWLLINPATPTLSTTTISAVRYRKTKTGDYTQEAGDEGYEISFTAAATLTLLTAPEFANRFFYVRNSSSGIITVDAGASYLIYGLGTRYAYLAPGNIYQLQTNGVDWHIMTSGGWPLLVGQADLAAVASTTFTGLVPYAKYRIEFDVVAAGSGQDVYIRFNSDALNYFTEYHVYANAVSTGSASTVGVVVSSSMDSGAPGVFGEVDFYTKYDDSTIVYAFGRSRYVGGGGGALFAMTSASRYDGAAALSSVQLIIVAGTTLTGRAWLYQVG